MLSHHRFTHTR